MRHKKYFYWGLTTLVVSVFIIITSTDSSLFSGAIKKFKIARPVAVTQLHKKEIPIQKTVDFAVKRVEEKQKEIEALKSQLPKKLHDELVVAETKFAQYKKRLESATDKEKQDLLHSYNHERLEDKIVYVKKMGELEQALNLLSLNITQIEQTISVLQKKKITFDTKALQKNIDIIKKYITSLKKLYKNKDFDNIAAQITALRKAVVSGLKQIETNAQNDPFGARREIVELIELIRELRLNIQIELPAPPEKAEEAGDTPIIPEEAPLAGETINVLVCAIRWEPETESDEAAEDPDKPAEMLGVPIISQADLEPVMERVAQYFEEVSYGNAHLSVQYAINNSWDGPMPDSLYTERLLAIEACDPLVDFETVDTMIVYPTTLVGMGGFSSSVAPVVTEEGEFSIGEVFVGSYNLTSQSFSTAFNAGIIEHEIGHAQFNNTRHANALDCGSSAFNVPYCHVIAYGNPFDVMGKSGNEGHFSGWGKYLAGWIPYRTVTENGTYELSVLEMPSSSSQLLRIPSEENPLCIEYRKPVGFDADLLGIPDNGCIVVNTCPLFGDRLLLDGLPNSAPGIRADIMDSCIREGALFENDALGISLSYNSITSDSVAVEIDVGFTVPEIDRSDLPDIDVSINPWDICDYYNPHFVSVENIGGAEIATPFTITVVGIDENGVETILEERTIDSFAPGEYLSLELGSINTFHALRAHVDIDSSTVEADTTNNEATATRCFYEVES